MGVDGRVGEPTCGGGVEGMVEMVMAQMFGGVQLLLRGCERELA